MKLMKRLAWIALLAQFMTGCSSSPVFKDPEKPNHSLVLMHIDMSDGPTKAHWVEATQYRPKRDQQYFGFVSDKELGTIMHHQRIVPGKYKLTSFGGTGSSWGQTTRYTFGFPPQGGLAKMDIKRPGIYYMGSFKYKKVKTGFFEQAKFTIEKQDKPTEKEVLTKFLAHVEKDGKWRKMIEKRIKELK